MKLAAQLFTVRDYCNSQDEVFRTLSRISCMGYDGVELESTLVKGIDKNKLAQVLDELGLNVCSIRNPFGRLGFEAKEMAEEAVAWKCHWVGIGTITGSYGFNMQDGYLRFAEKAAEAGEQLKQYGLSGLYSLRSQEFVRKADGHWGYDILEKELDGSNISIEADTFHLTRAGLYPTEIFERLPGRLPVVRLRDQRPAVGEVHFFYPVRENCPVGDGLFDFDDFMPALISAGTEWITLGQEMCARDPFECLERSLKKGRELLEICR